MSAPRWMHSRTARSRGRRRRDPLRGTQGRAGHARDARDHRRHQGRGARQGRAVDDRRPVLRRHHGAVRGPRRARRRSTPDPSRSSRDGDKIRLDVGKGTLDVLVDRPNSIRARRVSSRCRRSTPPVCWPSTPSWSARPRAARSAARSRPVGIDGVSAVSAEPCVRDLGSGSTSRRALVRDSCRQDLVDQIARALRPSLRCWGWCARTSRSTRRWFPNGRCSIVYS